MRRAARPKYIREICSIRYENKSCEHDKARCVNVGAVEEAKSH